MITLLRLVFQGAAVLAFFGLVVFAVVLAS